VEAKSNVSKRIEYIKGEMDRSESQLKSLENKNKDKEAEVGFQGKVRWNEIVEWGYTGNKPGMAALDLNGL